MMQEFYPLEDSPKFCSLIWGTNLTSNYQWNEIHEDPRIDTLRKLSYGFILPIICVLGIVGNILNLIVLTRQNMKGTAYIYMRGYSAAALLAIIFAIPFGIRMLVHRESGQWRNFFAAFYSAHLELFLGNGCLGVGVLMLLVLTLERYVSVCHPGYVKPFLRHPRLTVVLIPIITFLIYTPSIFRSKIVMCYLANQGIVVYHKRDNLQFLDTIFYSIYKIILEVVFKLAPTILIASLNLRIMIVYRRTCQKRRRMTSQRICHEDTNKFDEEKRLMLLLGSTSLLFLGCVSPMALLHVTLSEENLSSFSYQVFRAMANLLEIMNYSLTFYIYCLFSEDFRSTLLKTAKWPWFNNILCKWDNNINTVPIADQREISSKQHIQQTTTSGVCTLTTCTLKNFKNNSNHTNV